MKNIVYLPARSTAESVNFYVEELDLFDVAHDFGMDSILLQYKRCDTFFLLVSAETPAPGDKAPMFSIGVQNCVKEFERLKSVAFSNGPPFVEMRSVVEYPLGKFLKMADPAQNVFALYEWYI